MDRIRANDKKYLKIYRTFFECWKASGDKEIRSMFAYTLGRFKELAIAGVSKQARETAKKLNRRLPLSKPARNPFRDVLVCEHNLTKTQTLDALLEMETWNDKKALDILGTCRCYWITTKEDDKLTERGWKNKRPPRAYEKVGIEIEP